MQTLRASLDLAGCILIGGTGRTFLYVARNCWQAARVEKTRRAENLLVLLVKCQNEVVGDDSAKPLFDSTAPVWTREVEEDVAATTIILRRKDIPTTRCVSTLRMTFTWLVTLFLCMMKRIRRENATQTGAACTAEREAIRHRTGAAADRVLMARIRSDFVVCGLVHVSLASRVAKPRLSWAGPLVFL